MYTAYNSGAKYVVVFNYPTDPKGNPHGILSEEHFAAMQEFWRYTQSFRKSADKTESQVALILPKYYGGGLRRVDDHVWAPLSVNETLYNVTWRQKWPLDTQTPQIWESFNKLSERYGLRLDVVFEDANNINLIKRYQTIYLWNQTIT